MAYAQVSDRIPTKITAGTSVSWMVALPDFPASAGWTLTYTLVSPSAQVVVTSAPSADRHLFEITYATTGAWVAGSYAWQSHVSNGTERYQVDSGTVEIVSDFAEATTGTDTRTWLDTAIESLQASIAGRASKTQLTQSLPNGLQIQHMTLDQQISALKRLKAMRAGKDRSLKNIMRSRKVAF
jgi:hypothetical protein